MNTVKFGTVCVQDHLGPGSLDEGGSVPAPSCYHLLLSKTSRILGGHAGLAFTMVVLVLNPLVGLVGLVPSHHLHHTFWPCFLSELQCAGLSPRTWQGWDRGTWRKDVWSPVACGKWPKRQVPPGRMSALSPAPQAALHCQTPARSEDGDHAAHTFPVEHKTFGKLPEVGANSSVSFAN